MKRLTKNYPEHAAVLCDNCNKEYKSCGASDCLRAVAKRLAGIEDILGDTYDLDRLRVIVEADRRKRERADAKCGACKMFINRAALAKEDDHE